MIKQGRASSKAGAPPSPALLTAKGLYEMQDDHASDLGST